MCRERVFEAVERSYQQTVLDIGQVQPDAWIWTSAVMLRLRSCVAEHEEVGGTVSEAEN